MAKSPLAQFLMALVTRRESQNILILVINNPRTPISAWIVA